MNMQFDLGYSSYIALDRHAVPLGRYLPTEKVRIEFPDAILFLNNVVSIIHLRPGLALLSSSIGNVYPNPVIGKGHYMINLDRRMCRIFVICQLRIVAILVPVVR